MNVFLTPPAPCLFSSGPLCAVRTQIGRAGGLHPREDGERGAAKQREGNTLREQCTLQEKHRRLVGLRFYSHPWIDQLVEPRIAASRKLLRRRRFTPWQIRLMESEPISFASEMFSRRRRKELAEPLGRACDALQRFRPEAALARLHTAWERLDVFPPAPEGSADETRFREGRDTLALLLRFLESVRSQPA